MEKLYICNTFSDSISVINLNLFKEECRILLKKSFDDRIGPHGICIYNNCLLTANNFDNSLSLISLSKKKLLNNYFIGMHCNDVKVLNNNAFIICGDSNNVVSFNLTNNKIEEEIPCGNLPHSIDIYLKNKQVLTSDMLSDSITIFSIIDKNNIQNIRVGNFPTKAVFSVDGSIIYVCESNIGCDKCGSISLFSTKNLELISRISVGNSPVDMYFEKNLCYVSNFSDGTISIVDINKLKELNRIYVGGMPRGIIKRNEYIYVGDNFNNQVLKVNQTKVERRAVAIGTEPTGMLLF